MSGIAGIVHLDGRPVEPGLVHRMTAAMAYRGPDGIDHWASGPAALGHCQLRTTPESLEEAQPVVSADDQRVLVFDGRLDNWVELRQELLRRGARLRNRSDAELVLHAHETWGDACVDHLDGDFALALWDQRELACLLARDRFGNRALHYHWHGDCLSFATDVRPLLALPWTPKALDPDSLVEHLGIDWRTIDRSLWQGIFRVPPAMSVRFTRRSPPGFRRYWAPDPHQRLAHRSEAEHAEHYRSVLTDSVRRMSRALQPVSFEVSGGLDSSALFAAGAQLQRAGQLPAPGLLGFTLDFSGDAEADEMGYAQAVAEHVGLPVEPVSPFQPGLDWYRDSVRSTLDLPEYPNGAMNFSIAQRARSKGSRVVLSGTGGDEWAGGSPAYRAEQWANREWRAAMGLLWRDWREHGPRTGSLRFARQAIWPLLPPPVRDEIRRRVRSRSGHPLAPWLSPDLRDRLRRLSLQAPVAPPTHPVRIGQQRQVEMLWDPYWQSAKLAGERQMAQGGVEWRQPYWSRSVVELAFATPGHLHYRDEENKWLHRQAFKGLLPPVVIERQSKASFGCVFDTLWPSLTHSLRAQTLSRRESWLDLPNARKTIEKPHETWPEIWAKGPAWLLFCMDQLQACTPEIDGPFVA